MDFNIKDFLQKKIQKYNTPENIIVVILQEYISTIKKSNISINSRKIYLKNISPMQKTHIKLHKKKIIQKLSQKEIIVRDII